MYFLFLIDTGIAFPRIPTQRLNLPSSDDRSYTNFYFYQEITVINITMPGASASGVDTGGGTGAPRHREHNQGNQDRKATPEQIEAVVRIRRCSGTAYYDILNLESVRKTCTDTDIKKAYRKQSLLTHPDKNGHEHAAEAFKMVAKAFSILGDKDKRSKYDRFGGDPESRFGAAGGAGSAGSNPFAGFARRPGGAPPGFAAWDEDISPEEIFNRFFGGGGAGFGGPFGGTSSSFFNNARSGASRSLFEDPFFGESDLFQDDPFRHPFFREDPFQDPFFTSSPFSSLQVPSYFRHPSPAAPSHLSHVSSRPGDSRLRRPDPPSNRTRFFFYM